MIECVAREAAGQTEEFGIKEGDMDKAAEIAVSIPYWNRRSVEKGSIRELIRRSWAGKPARAGLLGHKLLDMGGEPRFGAENPKCS